MMPMLELAGSPRQPRHDSGRGNLWAGPFCLVDCVFELEAKLKGLLPSPTTKPPS